jgi:hypothetical protein
MHVLQPAPVTGCQPLIGLQAALRLRVLANFIYLCINAPCVLTVCCLFADVWASF